MTTTATPDTQPATPEQPAAPAPQPRPSDGGKLPYADPTGNQAASNVDRERAEPADNSKSGKEAAKYRRQLREVEAERDTLRSQLEAFQRQTVDQLAEKAGIRPAALWAAGTDLAGLLHDDGRVNHDAVTTAIAAASDALGLRPTTSAAGAGITAASRAIERGAATWAGITKAS